MNKLQFENSGFEVDDLYEILIASAIPAGAGVDTVHPLTKLFSDAQYEFMSARRGSVDDPNLFYCPAGATPANWYDEAAAQFWPVVNLSSSEVKPAAPATSSFAQRGGIQIAQQGVWKLKAEASNEAASRARSNRR